MSDNELTYIVCGEALFDVFIEQGIAANATSVPLAAKVGGSPFNVAIGLARLNRKSALLAGVSTDFLGGRLVSVLESEQVSTDHIARKNAPTTLALINVDEQGVPSYAFYGAGAADRALLAEDVAINPDGMTAIHLGSYSIVAQPTADSLFELVQRCRDRCLISLDPNIRPVVEPDMQVWRDRLDQLVPLVDMIKVSDEDLEALYPDRKPEAVTAAWLESGAKLVVLTRGGDGASMWSQHGHADISTPEVDVVDTVGAGDTFQAALLDSVGNLYRKNPDSWSNALDGAQLATIGIFAAAAAAITCSRSGADLPRLDEITL